MSFLTTRDREEKLKRAEEIQIIVGKLVSVVVEEAKNQDAAVAALQAAQTILLALPDCGRSER